MLTDPDNCLLNILLIILAILVHGFFVAVNTAFNATIHNDEKVHTSNRLIMVISALLGCYVAFPKLNITIAYFIFLMIFGQLFPYKLALQHSEGIYEKTNKFVCAISTILSLVSMILMLFTNIILKVFKQKTKVEYDQFSEEEVMSMLQVGKESGVIKEEGTKMINSIFAFDDLLAYEVMTPRTDVFSIDIEDDPEEYLEELLKMRHSRVPVCKGDSDNIIGILHIKDYLIKACESKFEELVDIESILRKAYFVPDTKNIDSLFFEMQKTKQQIAILIDEYGGFSGIVTMEDIIEEVMGNIDDEYDEEDEIIDKVDDNLYLVDGDVDLDDLDDELGIELKSENSETIGGFIIDILGEIPDEKDIGRIVEFENYKFKIMAVEERRIKRVKVYMPDNNSETGNDKN